MKVEVLVKMENVNVKRVLLSGYKIVEVISNVKTYEDNKFVFKKAKKYAFVPVFVLVYF